MTSTDVEVKFPIQRLLYSNDTLIAISGPHIHVFSASSAELSSSPGSSTSSWRSRCPAPQDEHTGAIGHIALDSQAKHLVTVGLEDKLLRVWRLDNLALLSSREIPKKATNVLVTPDSQTIVVSDKFGDVFSYPLHPDPTSLKPAPKPKLDPAQKRERVEANDNLFGNLVLGHASMITTMLLSSSSSAEDGSSMSIVTADRDEHIRISRFPEGYDIEAFCLGHTKFISALTILPASTSPSSPPQPRLLISAGGDPSLYIWSLPSTYSTSPAPSVIFQIPIHAIMRPYLAVSGRRMRRESREEAMKGVVKRREGRRGARGSKARRARRLAAEGEGEGEGDVEMAEGDGGAEEEVTAEPAATNEPKPELEPAEEEKEDEGEDPIVPANLTSFILKDGKTVLMWSGIGTTAIFYIVLLPGSTLTQDSQVKTLDFGIPVLHFAPLSGEDTILVSCDTNHAGSSNQVREATTNGIFEATWKNDELVIAAQEDAESRHSSLVSQLRDIRHAATPTQLRALELYEPLLTYPKWLTPDDADDEGEEGEGGSPLPTSNPNPRVESPRPGDKRRNTGERAEKRKMLRSALTSGSGGTGKE